MAGTSTRWPTRRPCRRSVYEPVVVDDLHAAPSWECNGQAKPIGASSVDAEYSPWECTAVPWFNDPAALDRPLAAGGPAAWKRADAAAARSVAKRALPAVDVSNITTTESSVRVRRVAHRGAGDGEDVVLPELGGRGGRRPLAGHAELHGGGAHEPARHAHVHHVVGRVGGAGAHDRGPRRSRRPGVVGASRPGAGRPGAGRRCGRFPWETSSAEGTISVPLPAVRTRGSCARLCARLHLQGLRRSRDLSRRDRRVDRPTHRERVRRVHGLGPCARRA